MGATRKLQGEIDRVLKKVQEGVHEFGNIWNKVYDTENANQKEKFEADLKKEIKKLQRYRDQIKTWCQSSEIKDKKPLLDARRAIEREMERFKICEKETKTKAFSKEGLGQVPKADPREKARTETREWLTQQISELELQIDSFEAEAEGLQVKKGKTRPARLTALEDSIARHKGHITKLEQILRLLDNDELIPDEVNNVRDMVEDYVERNQDSPEDFLDIDDCYSLLPLEKMEALDALEAVPAVAPTVVFKEKAAVAAATGTVVANLAAKPPLPPPPAAAAAAAAAAALVVDRTAGGGQTPPDDQSETPGGSVAEVPAPRTPVATSSPVGGSNGDAVPVPPKPPLPGVQARRRVGPGIAEVSSGRGATAVATTTTQQPSVVARSFTPPSVASSSTTVVGATSSHVQVASSNGMSSAAVLTPGPTVDVSKRPTSAVPAVPPVVVNTVEERGGSPNLGVVPTSTPQLVSGAVSSSMRPFGAPPGVVGMGLKPAEAAPAAATQDAGGAATEGMSPASLIGGRVFGQGGSSAQWRPQHAAMFQQSIQQNQQDPSYPGRTEIPPDQKRQFLAKFQQVQQQQAAGGGLPGLSGAIGMLQPGSLQMQQPHQQQNLMGQQGLPVGGVQIPPQMQAAAQQARQSLGPIQQLQPQLSSQLQQIQQQQQAGAAGSLSARPDMATKDVPHGDAVKLQDGRPLQQQQQPGQQHEQDLEQEAHATLGAAFQKVTLSEDDLKNADTFDVSIGGPGTLADLARLATHADLAGLGQQGINPAASALGPGVIGRKSSPDAGAPGDVPVHDHKQNLQLLEASYRHLPQSKDSERPRAYTPQRSPAVTPSSYPSSPSPIIDNPALWEKLDVDTLFFSFYYQQGTYQQYLAARELKKQSWRYHKKYQTWFQRHEEPKLTTEEYEQGTYVYFDFHIVHDDYQTGWCQRIKTEFTFEYSYLEDELAV